MSKYVIIHGQLRELSDDELMHWKYIKREKKNGKWVYYYDDRENKLSSLKKKVMDLEYTRNNKYRSHISKLKAEDYARANEDWERKNVDSWYSNKSIMDHERHYFDSYGKGKYITKDINRTKDEIKKHSKTITGKIDDFMSKNGYKIAKSLNKTSSKINKAKNYINSLFSKKKTTKSSSSKNVIKENVIKENVIKENVIKENVIKENVIKENVIKGDTIKERKKKK